MPTTVTLPKLSPTMEEGRIVTWHKKVGDKVEVDDVLCEIETDKATVECTSFDSGYLAKILVQENELAPVNKAIAILTANAGEDISSYTPEEPDYAPDSNDEEVTEEGEEVAPKAHSTGSRGQMASPAFVPYPPLESIDFAGTANEGAIKASPLAKRIAREKGLDLSNVKGSGPAGRIVEKDLNHAPKLSEVQVSRGEMPKEIGGSYEEIPLSQMRKVIGDRLQAAKTFIPHFYVTDEVIMDKVLAMRAELKDLGKKYTINDFIMRAVALALRKFPSVNSGYNSETNQIIQFKTVDLCIAVAIPDGLITPIIRHADFKDLTTLSLETKDLAKRAKEGKLALHEFQGGSFTLSNLGMYGIKNFSAIINPPQAGILAVGGMHKKPIVLGGAIAIGNVMEVTLSCDHRVIDGALAADFVHTVKKYLESPSLLLL